MRTGVWTLCPAIRSLFSFLEWALWVYLFYHGILKFGASNALPQGDFLHWLQPLQHPTLCKHIYDSSFLNFFCRSGVPNNIETYPTALLEDIVVKLSFSSEKKKKKSLSFTCSQAGCPNAKHNTPALHNYLMLQFQEMPSVAFFCARTPQGFFTSDIRSSVVMGWHLTPWGRG